MKLVVAAISVVTLLGCQTETGPDIAESGVGVVARGCAGTTAEVGSGMTIGRDGNVVTTAHTVAGATDITVVDSAGVEAAATVIAFDKDADLALLDVPGLSSPPRSVGQTDVGEALAVVWSPAAGVRQVPVTVTKRLKITIEDIYVEDEISRSGLELSGDIAVGDSGGAIVGEDGDIIGVIYARSRQRPRTAFATDHSELARFLNDRPLDATDRCQ